MEYQDYYQRLGVSRDASSDEIKKSYRRLARKYHPDVSQEKDAEEKFKAVKEAYEVLSNADKRKAYDQMGSDWQQGQGFEPPPGWNYQQSSHSEHMNPEDFSDFFEHIFGQQRHAQQQRAHQRGSDQHVKLSISLEDAFQGAVREIQLREPHIDRSQGVTYKTKTLRVKIPAGATQGQLIRLAGQGSPGIGDGPKGDLYLEIDLLPHPHFTVDNQNIRLVLPIAPWEAALGAKVSVPTLGGRVDMQIPAGSQTGNTLRLKGRGLPGKTSGDQYVSLKIVTPPANTEQAKALYEQMQQNLAFDPRADFDKGSAT